MFRDCGPHAVPFIDKYFYDCVYTKQDLVGFCLGMTSIAIWIVAQIPQFVSNVKNQSAEALSPWFLANWLMGDTCNLLGCLIQGEQLPTTTYTAMYFVVADAVMMIQYIYYNALQKRVERMRQRQSRHRHNKHRHHSAEGATSEHSTVTIEAGTSQPAPPALLPRGTAAIVSATAALLLVTYIHQTSLTHLLPTAPAHSRAHSINNTHTAHSTHNIVPPSSRSLSFTPLAAGSYPLVGPADPAQLRQTDWYITVGTGLGWVSSVLYLMSRISQIVKNHQRQSAEGLSLAMFACAVTANLLTGMSIILRADGISDLLGTQGPWIVGSLGTISLDVIIFSQAIYFGALWKSGQAGQAQQPRDRDRASLEAPLLHGAQD